MLLGLELMLYGLAGVFSILIIFMLTIKIITAVLPYREDGEKK